MAALTSARARVARLLRSPPAGPYASNISLVIETNNVGGSFLGMPLPPSLQSSLFNVTRKDFTGTIRQLALGYTPEYTIMSTTLFFTTGSVQVMGARSADAIRLVIHHICAVLRANGHRPYIRYMSIDNKVVVANLGFHVDLKQMNGQLHGFATTLTPAFPGLVCTYQSENRVVTFMVFSSGSVMVLGIQDLTVVNKIYFRLVAMASQFRTAPQRARAHGRAGRTVTATAGRSVPRVNMREIAGKISLAIQAALDTNHGAMTSPNLDGMLQDVVASVIGPAPPAPKRTVVDAYAY